MPTTTNLASKVRSLLNDSRELERLRKQNASLLVEIKGLRQDSAEIARLLGGPVRKTSTPAAKSSKPASSASKPAAAKSGKRFRTSAADVEKMYRAITSKAPSDWKTKADIIKSAGLSVDGAKAAWKWATEGVTLDGKKHAAVLKSNGSRGFKGRYRKA